MPITSDMNTPNPRRLHTFGLINSFGTKHGFIPVPGTGLLKEWNKSDLIGLFDLYIYLWTIEPAEILLSRTSDGSTPNPNSDYAILNILNPLPEFLGRCLNGSRETDDGYERYKQGMNYILSQDSPEANDARSAEDVEKQKVFYTDIFYYYLRNGLGHTLYTRNVVELERFDYAAYPKIDGKQSVFYIKGDLPLAVLVNGYPAAKAEPKDRKRYIEKNHVVVRLDARNYLYLNKLTIESFVAELDKVTEKQEMFRNFRLFITGES